MWGVGFALSSAVADFMGEEAGMTQMMTGILLRPCAPSLQAKLRSWAKMPHHKCDLIHQ
jgi:hypothetical protein